MGPISRYLGSEVPSKQLIWQDPIPELDFNLVDKQDIISLKNIIKESELSISQLVSTAWASASTFRGTDKRGGANGARIALKPQIDWEVNQPKKLKIVLETLSSIKKDFNQSQSNKKISLADLIVLAGYVGVENAAKNSGHDINFDFKPGRNDARQEETDINSCAFLETKGDGFRNYMKDGCNIPAEELLLDKAHLLTLTAPEMSVILAGLRVLDVNFRGNQHGVLTKKTGVLTNDFFVNLLDMNIIWEASQNSTNLFEGHDRITGDIKWTGTRADLIFGSNSQLRAIVETYACDDTKEKFVHDFAKTWQKIMNLDRL